jgi:glucokinase
MAPPGQPLFAGLDIGGTKIAAVIADSRGEITASGVIATEPSLGPELAGERAAALLRELEGRCTSEFLAVGAGAPGLVDSSTGKVLLLPNLPEEWQNFNLVERLTAALGRPAYLLNDARLAALGEYTFGARPRSADMLFVTVGTGVGGGLIFDGKLRMGAYGAAGELGHHTVLPDGPQCGCGSRGCLETLVSGPALTKAGRALLESGRAPGLCALASGDSSRVTPLLMAEAAREGDVDAAEAIEHAATYLGIGIANAISITAVQEVVVGGGLAFLGDRLLGPVRRVVRERVRMFPSSSIRIRCSSLGANAGALGGVALALQEYSKDSSAAPNPFMETFQ